MSQVVDLSALARMADEVLNGKEYFVGTILERLNEASEYLPHDQAVRTAQKILQGRLNKEGSLATMSQKEFQGLYDEVCGLGNKQAFRELLNDFLYVTASEPVAHYNQDFVGGLRHTDNVLEIANPDLVNEFNSLFDEHKVASGSFIDNGRKGLEIELASLGVANPIVEVVARNNNFVIYATQLDSTHGPIEVLIPSEIKLGHALMPSVFISGAEFVNLTTDNLIRHAHETAMGNRTKPNAPQVLSVLTAALQDAIEDGSLEKTASAGEFSPELNLFASSPIYKRIDDSQSAFEVEAQYADLPVELEHLTEGTIREALVEAGLSFDKEVVAAVKGFIASELAGMGIQTGKITVASEFDGGLMIAANIIGRGGQKTIEMPIEVIAGQILMPSVFSSGAEVQSFNEATLKAFANDEGKGIFRTAFSDKLGWSYQELHEHALKNASRGNFIEAEEALAIINDEYGQEFHRVAFNDLTALLSLAVTEEQRPIHAMERYIEEAIAQSQHQDANFKMSETMLYLHPED